MSQLSFLKHIQRRSACHTLSPFRNRNQPLHCSSFQYSMALLYNAPNHSVKFPICSREMKWTTTPQSVHLASTQEKWMTSIKLCILLVLRRRRLNSPLVEAVILPHLTGNSRWRSDLHSENSSAIDAHFRYWNVALRKHFTQMLAPVYTFLSSIYFISRVNIYMYLTL